MWSTNIIYLVTKLFTNILQPLQTSNLLTTMTVGIALIGSGIFAKEEHLPAIQKTPSLSLKAVYSRSLKSAKTLSENLSDVELYSDDSDGKKYEDLLKRDDIKGVVIA